MLNYIFRSLSLVLTLSLFGFTKSSKFDRNNKILIIKKIVKNYFFKVLITSSTYKRNLGEISVVSGVQVLDSILEVRSVAKCMNKFNSNNDYYVLEYNDISKSCIFYNSFALSNIDLTGNRELYLKPNR